MARIDAKNRAIQAKLVYYGPGLCGKTTNLQFINRRLAPQQELMSLATEGDVTIFFDFMPLDLGKIRDMDVQFKLYTVPGQVRYNQTRKMVLKNVDGVVFVADSQPAMMDGNLESLDNLYENLGELGIDSSEIVVVLQYNKRDLPNVLTLDELDAQLNAKQLPRFAASAMSGDGVIETLKDACKRVLSGLESRFTGSGFVAPATKRKGKITSPGNAPAPNLSTPNQPPAAAPAQTEAAKAAPPAAASPASAKSATEPATPPGKPAVEPAATPAKAVNAPAAPAVVDSAPATTPEKTPATQASTAPAQAPSRAATPSAAAAGHRPALSIKPRAEPKPSVAQPTPIAASAPMPSVSSDLEQMLAHVDALRESMSKVVLELIEGAQSLKREVTALAATKPRASAPAPADLLRQLEERLPSKSDWRALHDAVGKLPTELVKVNGNATPSTLLEPLRAQISALPTRAQLESLLGKNGTAPVGKSEIEALAVEVAALPRKSDLSSIGESVAKIQAETGDGVRHLERALAQLSEAISGARTGGGASLALDPAMFAGLASKDDVRGLPSKDEVLALATKDDVRALSTKDDLRLLATKDDLHGFASKDDVRALATKDDLHGFASKDDLSALATKGDLRGLADRSAHWVTKAELAAVEARISTLPSKDDLTAFEQRISAALQRQEALLDALRERAATPALERAPATDASQQSPSEASRSSRRPPTSPPAEAPAPAVAPAAEPSAQLVAPPVEVAPPEAVAPSEAAASVVITPSTEYESVIEPAPAVEHATEATPPPPAEPASEPAQAAEPAASMPSSAPRESSASGDAAAPETAPDASSEPETPAEPAAAPSAEPTVPEAPPADKPADVAPPQAMLAATAAAAEAFADDPAHQNAARIARVMVADLYLYNKEGVEQGIREGDFHTRNKEALDDMRLTFDSRVPQSVREKVDYLAIAIDAFIAKKRTQWGLS